LRDGDLPAGDRQIGSRQGNKTARVSFIAFGHLPNKGLQWVVRRPIYTFGHRDTDSGVGTKVGPDVSGEGSRRIVWVMGRH
jgi:hypothetical protein